MVEDIYFSKQKVKPDGSGNKNWRALTMDWRRLLEEIKTDLE